MRRPVKPYVDINPFELLQKQNYLESLSQNPQSHYMSAMMNQIPPPPYSLHNFHSVTLNL